MKGRLSDFLGVSEGVPFTIIGWNGNTFTRFKIIDNKLQQYREGIVNNYVEDEHIELNYLQNAKIELLEEKQQLTSHQIDYIKDIIKRYKGKNKVVSITNHGVVGFSIHTVNNNDYYTWGSRLFDNLEICIPYPISELMLTIKNTKIAKVKDHRGNYSIYEALKTLYKMDEPKEG